jgi:hypothetical protein
VLISLTALPVSAATMKAVFTGTIKSGLNHSGVFGLLGLTSLNGKPFELTFIYDTTVGSLRDTVYEINLSGGQAALLPGPSPMLSASLSINGFSKAWTGSVLGEISMTKRDQRLLYRAHDYDPISEDPSEGGVYRNVEISINRIVSSDIPLSLDTPFGLDLSYLQGYQGYFRFSGYFNYQKEASADFDLARLDVSRYEPTPPPAPIPLPASAFLLLAGIAGLAGLDALRRRRET